MPDIPTGTIITAAGDCPGRVIENHGYDLDGNDTGDVYDCVLPVGHDGDHQAGDGHTWAKAPHE